MDFLVFVKVFGIFATVICAYVGIFASWMLQGYAKTRDGNNVVKRANCVAAGVLLSVALVHVLPDAIGDVGLWAPILAGCSYILLFGLEIAVGGMFAVGEALEVEGDGDGGSLSTEPTSSSGTGSRTGEHAAPAGNAQSQQSQAAGGGAFTPKGCGELGGRAINTDDCKVVNVNVVAPDGTVVQSTTKAAVPDLGVVKATLLFAALMVHSVLEGLGMGSADNVGVASSTLIAIVAHKGLAAFALGQTLRTNSGVQNHEVTLAAPLLQHLSSEGEARPEFVAIGMDDPPLREPEHVACSKARTRFLVFTTIFAFSSPLGAVLGLVFFGNGAGPWSAYCSALTAGTFLQISMNELIPAALSAGGAPLVENLKRLAALCAGFGAMSLMALLGA
eukprot:g10376.t1